LLIGAEKVSYFLDWKQRDTAVLFGDAAGAVVIENVDGDSKLHSSKLGCDPAQGKALMLENFGSNMKINNLSIEEEANFFGITFDGQEVFKHAVRTMAKLAKEVLEEANLTMEDIELCIPHQANARILQATARRCDLPLEKVFINLEKYGNTSAASIPVALTEALEQNKIKQNSKILFLAFGAGLTSAAAIIDWGSRIQSIKKSRAALPACSKTGLELINQA
jgi:3-oxoacyl-[acyl-carrier-protein] synthase-3